MIDVVSHKVVALCSICNNMSSEFLLPPEEIFRQFLDKLFSDGNKPLESLLENPIPLRAFFTCSLQIDL